MSAPPPEGEPPSEAPAPPAEDDKGALACGHVGCKWVSRAGSEAIRKAKCAAHESSLDKHEHHLRTAGSACGVCARLVASGEWAPPRTDGGGDGGAPREEGADSDGPLGEPVACAHVGCSFQSPRRQNVGRHEVSRQAHRDHVAVTNFACGKCQELLQAGHWAPRDFSPPLAALEQQQQQQQQQQLQQQLRPAGSRKRSRSPLEQRTGADDAGSSADSYGSYTDGEAQAPQPAKRRRLNYSEFLADLRSDEREYYSEDSREQPFDGSDASDAFDTAASARAPPSRQSLLAQMAGIRAEMQALQAAPAGLTVAQLRARLKALEDSVDLIGDQLHSLGSPAPPAAAAPAAARRPPQRRRAASPKPEQK